MQNINFTNPNELIDFVINKASCEEKKQIVLHKYDKLFDKGDFSFTNCQETREMLKDMYDSVEKINGWEQLKNIDLDLKNLSEFIDFEYKIRKNLKLDNDHSNSSYRYTLRNTIFIAKYGWYGRIATWNI